MKDMEKTIDYVEAAMLPQALFVDVRSESEFAADHIPGAINLPVLNDAERAATGKVYHQLSPKEARQLGLEIISPKLPALVRQVTALAQKRQVILYCWRGGMRSACLSVVLDLMHVPVYRLQGGYKTYRNWVNQYWQKPLAQPVWVLCGNTGVGKTLVLHELASLGCQAIDLEGLAGHRGSTFGLVGLAPQPTQKAFESRLYTAISQLDPTKPLLLECESKRIGKLTLPDPLHRAIVEGKRILLYDTIPNRVAKILADYQPEKAILEVQQALAHLTPYLGKQKIQDMLEQLRNQDFATVVASLLTDYYDHLYRYPNEPDSAYSCCFMAADPKATARAIAQFLEKDDTLAEVKAF